MHMADALLSPSVGAAFWVVSGTAVAYSARKLKQEADEKKIPLMGILGAFVFAAQMINFTIPGTGSSGHLAGGMILAVLLGPYAGFLTLASVLVVQALFFGDGGILALGCNVFNMGFWACFVAYPLIYKPLAGKDPTPGRATLAALVSVLAAMQLGPLSVVIETLLSGISELPFLTFVLLMLPIHMAIGLVEGFVTAGLIAFVRKTRPEILQSAATARPLGGVSIRKVLIGLAAAALVTGGILSWFASTHPDGLEWSITKIYGKPDLPAPARGIIPALEAAQEKTAILPDYGFRKEEPVGEERGEEGGTWPAVSSGTTVAGIVGSVMTLGLSVLVGLFLRRRARGTS
ncbi:MAG: energy-coupling factor ABC transporter permease [Deltaproteobacteria bacterium]|nr:energy-coupling factor ABC transporter permease [Deltaproteobacteria bacterium]